MFLGNSINTPQGTAESNSPTLPSNLINSETCPLLDSLYFQSECGIVQAKDSLDNSKSSDPWKTPSAFLTSGEIQWIDFTFIDLLKSDELTGQVNFTAIPSLSDSACIYMNRKVNFL